MAEKNRSLVEWESETKGKFDMLGTMITFELSGDDPVTINIQATFPTTLIFLKGTIERRLKWSLEKIMTQLENPSKGSGKTPEG